VVEHESGAALTPLPSSAGQCRVYLQVNPDGLSFLAQVRFPSSAAVPRHALPETGEEASGGLVPVPEVSAAGEVDTATLLRIMRQVHDLVHGCSADAAGATPDWEGLERARLEEENRRLREALGECVSACDRFLSRAGDALPFEGYEADHALAQLALEQARQTLGETPGLIDHTVRQS
jgi:hypothetical protein